MVNRNEPPLSEVCDKVELLDRCLDKIFSVISSALSEEAIIERVEEIQACTFPYDQLLRVRRCMFQNNLRVCFPLHSALAKMQQRQVDNNFQIKVLEVLLEAFPDEVEVEKENPFDRLPLHIYLASGSKTSRGSIDVVKTLMEAFPPGTSSIDSIGRYPLHCALSSCLSLIIVKHILKSYPQAALQIDDAGWKVSWLLERNYDCQDEKTEILTCFQEELSETAFQTFLTTESEMNNSSFRCCVCQDSNRKFLLSAIGTIQLNGAKENEVICLKCAKCNGYNEHEVDDDY